jgi:hypothetical protein
MINLRRSEGLSIKNDGSDNAKPNAQSATANAAMFKATRTFTAASKVTPSNALRVQNATLNYLTQTRTLGIMDDTNVQNVIGKGELKKPRKWVESASLGMTIPPL